MEDVIENVDVNNEPEDEIRDPAAVLEALKTANGEAKKFREESEALKERIQALEGDEGVARWKSKAVNAYAKAALREEGVKDVGRVLKYLSLEGIDLDDNDNLVGFKEKVETLKKDLPELFDKKRQVGPADAFAADATKKNLTSTELQVARLYKR